MVQSTCWPNDPDYAPTEIRLPSNDLLRAYWDVDILDSSGVDPGTIISVSDAFQVRIRLELGGPAWRCMAGDWRFEVFFEGYGTRPEFELSTKIGTDPLLVRNWKGCEGPDPRCIERMVTVPAGTVPAGTYRLAAEMQLYCCDKPAAITGHEAIGEVQWYVP